MTNDDYSYLQHESIRTDARNLLLSLLQAEVEKLDRFDTDRNGFLDRVPEGELVFLKDVLDLIQRLKGDK